MTQGWVLIRLFTPTQDLVFALGGNKIARSGRLRGILAVDRCAGGSGAHSPALFHAPVFPVIQCADTWGAADT